MGTYQINRPEEQAMAAVLAANQGNAAGMILRLAFLQGLQREEITFLTWDRVSFLDGVLRLPDREVPMDGAFRAYLEPRRAEGVLLSPYVVVSERYRRRMQPEAVSRVARRELDRAGLTKVRLVDLRNEYIIRQLADHDCGYVSRVSGVEIRSLQLHFGPYIAAGSGKARREGEAAEIDEFRLWKILQAERDTPAGLALWLTWQMGLSGSEIVSLRWEQVDMGANVIRLPDREVPLTSAVSRMLESRRQRDGGTGNVLLSERARKPVDMARLSRMVRSALIRGGMENLTLKDLQRDALRVHEERLVLEEIRRRGAVSRREAAELLGVTPRVAYTRLRRLTETKKLVLIGAKYYAAGDVVPPERHEAVIREYLVGAGFAYRQDVARLLGIGERQCSLILKRMVTAGELVRRGQKYCLPPAGTGAREA
ncbi:DNA glycosylase AlkZ-like family protein [Dysosmobacter sp.]|uniref:DNA glycosylase AlkZ-like family protein n=1 Tax=Dysosmobacter sp. TaxID=2591382 RepID=UPI002A8559A0|nr:crosslink repair DNA glycosylase YcaQ family protein [Dysosmobacter sp.]MDY3282582.1 hypothetical protein [Dysosmobacter sp.]